MAGETPWGNDDASWWHYQDQLMQEQEEAERIEECNRRLDEIRDNALERLKELRDE